MSKQVFKVSFIVGLFFLLPVDDTQAQPTPKSTTLSPSTLKVTSVGTAHAEADIIELSIQLNSEDANVDKAYRNNQQLQQKLIQLIKRYNIKENSIQLQPLSITPHTLPHRTRSTSEVEPEKRYRVRQLVVLTLSDRKKYVDLQRVLINNGFDEFRGTFKSTKAGEAKEKALRLALQNAKKRAQIISEEAEVTLKTIQSIVYNESERPVTKPARYASTMRSEEALVTEFDQFITVKARVTIEYLLSDD